MSAPNKLLKKHMSQNVFVNIDVALARIEEQITALQEDAVAIVDDYWTRWRIKNKQLASLGESSKGGEYAPRVVVRSGKVYIEWLRYRPGRVGARSKSWGDRVNPKNDTYRIDQFKGARDWESEMIAATEGRFNPIRKALNALHECKVKLVRVGRSNESSDDESLKTAVNS